MQRYDNSLQAIPSILNMKYTRCMGLGFSVISMTFKS